MAKVKQAYHMSENDRKDRLTAGVSPDVLAPIFRRLLCSLLVIILHHHSKSSRNTIIECLDPVGNTTSNPKSAWNPKSQNPEPSKSTFSRPFNPKPLKAFRATRPRGGKRGAAPAKLPLPTSAFQAEKYCRIQGFGLEGFRVWGFRVAGFEVDAPPLQPLMTVIRPTS